MKRYIRATELLDFFKKEVYKGYDIVQCLYGNSAEDSLNGYYTWGEYTRYSVGYERNAPEFDTVEEARAYIDTLIKE